MQITWEEFREQYKPKKLILNGRNHIESYQVDPKDKVSRNQIFNTYGMYIWSVVPDGEEKKLISKLDIANAIGYVTSEVPHDMDEEVIVKLNK
jgi:hypothetical protein